MLSAWFCRFVRFSAVRSEARRSGTGERPHRRWTAPSLVAAPLLAAVLAVTVFVPEAVAAQTVQLRTAAPFAVLAGTAVTDVPTSSITGDVGLSPATGADYAGLTQAEVDGTIYSTDGTGPAGNVNDPALLTTAKNDLTTAYVAAAGQPATTTFTTGDNQLGGQTLVPGVYAFGHAATANLTAASPLVLNGEGDDNAVFIFQASSDLVTAANSVVQLENGAQACNVFWQVGSSATLNSSSTFVGTIMALTSATLGSGATVHGRVLARNGAVTLDAAPTSCATTTPTTTTTTSPGAPTTTTAPSGTTGTTTPGGGSGSTGGSGSSAGSGSGTGSITTTGSTSSGEAAAGTGSAAGTSGTTAVIPSGSPRTGLGGAAHATDDRLVALGAMALLASAGAVTMAVRRRRLPTGSTTAPSTR
jgi:hypothetical protein